MKVMPFISVASIELKIKKKTGFISNAFMSYISIFFLLMFAEQVFIYIQKLVLIVNISLIF